MKKIFALSFAVLMSLSIGLASTAMAEKKHAPKIAWGTMLMFLGNVQSATASLMVFDMKNVAKRAEEIQGRATYISNIKSVPEAWSKRYRNLAAAATKLGAAAKSGEENDVAMALGGVVQSCNACHYDLRDAGRRKKMK